MQPTRTRRIDFDTPITNQTITFKVIAEHIVNATDPDEVDFIFTPH